MDSEIAFKPDFAKSGSPEVKTGVQIRGSRDLIKKADYLKISSSLRIESSSEFILKYLRSQKVVESGSTFDCWSRGEFTG